MSGHPWSRRNDDDGSARTPSGKRRLSGSEQARTDAELLAKLLADDVEGVNEDARTAFADMLERCRRGTPLSDRQRAWAEGVADRVGVVLPALNLASRGLVPRGSREVETPECLRHENLPMKPPGRER